MCGRFVRESDVEAIVEEFDIELNLCDLKPSYNVAPTQNIAVIIEDQKRKLVSVRWGLVPRGAADLSIGGRLINARAETVAQRSAFKEAFRGRRCLVVADGFYEWQWAEGRKHAIYIRLKNGRPFGFAGLYEHWRPEEGDPITTCTVITCEPNELMRPIHDRMPVIIPRDGETNWLDPTFHDVPALMSMLKAYPADQMETREVSSLVNSVANDSPMCIEPLAARKPGPQRGLPFGD